MSTPRGVSEEIIGRWFAARPAQVTERVVLATKGRFRDGRRAEWCRAVSSASDPGAGRLAASARGGARGPLPGPRLRPVDPLEETVRTLDNFVRAGKISYWGLSNFTGWQLTKIVGVAEALGAAGRSRCNRSTA